nr:hypothetical protein [uncultured Methylotenera sp.]
MTDIAKPLFLTIVIGIPVSVIAAMVFMYTTFASGHLAISGIFIFPFLYAWSVARSVLSIDLSWLAILVGATAQLFACFCFMLLMQTIYRRFFRHAR